MSISSASALPITTIQRTRRAALIGIGGAAITVIGAIVVQGVVQPSTSVSDQMWSYPWSASALIPVSILWALAHALVLVGLLGFARSGAAGPRPAARYGLAAVLTGTTLLLIGELASILVRHEQTDAAGATAVGAIFGVGTVLSAIGFLLVGWQTLRTARWHGWRQYTPMAAGVWCVALLGITATKALPTGVGIYGLCLLALSVALYTAPAPDDASTRAPG